MQMLGLAAGGAGHRRRGTVAVVTAKFGPTSAAEREVEEERIEQREELREERREAREERREEREQR